MVLTLDAESNKNIKILLKGNWNFPKHIFNKNIERILNNNMRLKQFKYAFNKFFKDMEKL